VVRFPRGQAGGGEEVGEVGLFVGGEIGLVEIGREDFQQPREPRLIGALERVGEGEQAARLEDAGDLGGDGAPHVGGQFVEEIDAGHRIDTAVGEGKPLDVGLDEGGGFGPPGRFLQVGGGKIGADQAGAGKGQSQVAKEGARAAGQVEDDEAPVVAAAPGARQE